MAFIVVGINLVALKCLSSHHSGSRQSPQQIFLEKNLLIIMAEETGEFLGEDDPKCIQITWLGLRSFPFFVKMASVRAH